MLHSFKSLEWSHGNTVSRLLMYSDTTIKIMWYKKGVIIMKFGNTTCLGCACQVRVEGLGGCDQQVNCSHKPKMSKRKLEGQNKIYKLVIKQAVEKKVLSLYTGQGGSDQYVEHLQGTGCSVWVLPHTECVWNDIYKRRVQNHIGLYWSRWDLLLSWAYVF